MPFWYKLDWTNRALRNWEGSRVLRNQWGGGEFEDLSNHEQIEFSGVTYLWGYMLLEQLEWIENKANYWSKFIDLVRNMTI